MRVHKGERTMRSRGEGRGGLLSEGVKQGGVQAGR